MEKQKISLILFTDSWSNIFECLRARGTHIETKGNFWAAIQHLEEQWQFEKINLDAAATVECKDE